MRPMALATTVVLGLVAGAMNDYYKTNCVPGAELSEQIARACIRQGYVYWSPFPSKKLFPPLLADDGGGDGSADGGDGGPLPTTSA